MKNIEEQEINPIMENMINNLKNFDDTCRKTTDTDDTGWSGDYD